MFYHSISKLDMSLLHCFTYEMVNEECQEINLAWQITYIFQYIKTVWSFIIGVSMVTPPNRDNGSLFAKIFEFDFDS